MYNHVITGDTCIFDPMAGSAIVSLAPATINGTGMWDVGGKKVCVEGDELTVTSMGTYTKGPMVGGSCMVQITSLAQSQKSQKCKSNGKVVIMTTGLFNTTITVMSPAIAPGTPPVPDPVPMYMGTGSFVTSNAKVTVA